MGGECPAKDNTKDDNTKDDGDESLAAYMRGEFSEILMLLGNDIHKNLVSDEHTPETAARAARQLELSLAFVRSAGVEQPAGWRSEVLSLALTATELFQMIDDAVAEFPDDALSPAARASVEVLRALVQGPLAKISELAQEPAPVCPANAAGWLEAISPAMESLSEWRAGWERSLRGIAQRGKQAGSDAERIPDESLRSVRVAVAEAARALELAVDQVRLHAQGVLSCAVESFDMVHRALWEASQLTADASRLTARMIGSAIRRSSETPSEAAQALGELQELVVLAFGVKATVANALADSPAGPGVQEAYAVSALDGEVARLADEWQVIPASPPSDENAKGKEKVIETDGDDATRAMEILRKHRPRIDAALAPVIRAVREGTPAVEDLSIVTRARARKLWLDFGGEVVAAAERLTDAYAALDEQAAEPDVRALVRALHDSARVTAVAAETLVDRFEKRFARLGWRALRPNDAGWRDDRTLVDLTEQLLLHAQEHVHVANRALRAVELVTAIPVAPVVVWPASLTGRLRVVLANAREPAMTEVERRQLAADNRAAFVAAKQAGEVPYSLHVYATSRGPTCVLRLGPAGSDPEVLAQIRGMIEITEPAKSIVARLRRLEPTNFGAVTVTGCPSHCNDAPAQELMARELASITRKRVVFA
jgi:hypothetical protein